MPATAKKMAKDLARGDIIDPPAHERTWIWKDGVRRTLRVDRTAVVARDRKGEWIGVACTFSSPYGGGASDMTVWMRPGTKVALRADHVTEGTADDYPLRAILECPLPAVRCRTLRHLGRRAWARHLRALFADLGFVGVSVTVPAHSMASSVEIAAPRGPENLRDRANRKLRSVAAAAFPDLDDRSDAMVDHFDFCLTSR